MVTGEGEGIHGTTWGARGGATALLRMRLGPKVGRDELASDWTMTHELVHTAFPDLPEAQEWLQEGVATYVEPIARVQIGDLDEKRIWSDMMRDMPQGQPVAGDGGLDATHTWARTYWGGALFCMQADVAIRSRTKNAKGLQDALRAIANAGGTIAEDWSVEKVIAVGDAATGTHVLAELFAAMAKAPGRADLSGTWQQLGAHPGKLDSSGAGAELRHAIARPMTHATVTQID